MRDQFLKAIELANAGEWTAAHEIVQQHEGTPVADWIHAVLHKIEGDAENSRYWYRRAGKMEFVEREAAAELGEIRTEIEGE